MKLIAVFAGLLALQACASAPEETFPIPAGERGFVLSSVPADQIPDMKGEEMAKAEAYCRQQNKTASIGAIATNVARGAERRNEVYFKCVDPVPPK